MLVRKCSWIAVFTITSFFILSITEGQNVTADSQSPNATNNSGRNCVAPYGGNLENGQISLSSSLYYDEQGNQKIYSREHFKCNDNYGLFPPNELVGCQDNIQYGEYPLCLRTCPPRISEFVQTYCEKDGLRLDCVEPVVDGATVSMKCKPRYDEDNPFNRPAVECDTVCGQIAPQGKPLIINGKNSKIGEFPWHVGIYKKSAVNSTYDYQCGGSVINPKVVLTAAHCFTEGSGILFNVEEFYIAAGKYFRNYKSPLDSFAQKREVEMIHIPGDYNGFLSSYSADIAVVIVSRSFKLTNAVRPICLDWNNVFEGDQLKTTNFGKIVGWGYTKEGRKLAPALKQLTIPYIEREKCVKLVPEHFIRFVTPDKFCAGYQNGSSVCNGDSGGGLVFYREEDKKYYIRGLVSIGPINSGTCDSHQYGAFTKISHYMEYIKSIVEKYSEKCKRLYNKIDNDTIVGTCSNGTWDTPLITCLPECGETVPLDNLLVLGGSPIKKNNFPWHVGVYRRDLRRFHYGYLCGGSIISVKLVLTDMYCFYEVVEYNLDNLYVATGKYYREYDSPHDVLTQQRKVIRIEYNEEEKNSIKEHDPSMSWDVGILVTEEPFTLNNFVRPVCIDWDNSLSSSNMSFGTLTDWELTFKDRSEATNELKQITVPFNSNEECGNFVGRKKDLFCTFLSNETEICSISNGVGLVTYNKDNKKYYLQGIVSVAVAERSCNLANNIRYTSIATYLDFIKSIELKYRTY